MFEASRSAEAVDVFDRLDGGVDLLVTDMVMPGGTGSDLFQALVARRSDLRALFISGYPEGTSIERYREVPGVAFLGKPFTVGRLLRAVREVLDR